MALPAQNRQIMRFARTQRTPHHFTDAQHKPAAPLESQGRVCSACVLVSVRFACLVSLIVCSCIVHRVNSLCHHRLGTSPVSLLQYCLRPRRVRCSPFVASSYTLQCRHGRPFKLFLQDAGFVGILFLSCLSRVFVRPLRLSNMRRLRCP